MAIKSNNAEGYNSGDAVAAGTSGGTSGDAFTGVSIPAGSTLTASTAALAHGSLGYAVTTTSASVAVYAAWANLEAASRQVLAVSVMFPTALPTSDTYLAAFRLAVGTSASLMITAAGKLQMTSSTGGAIAGTLMTSALVVGTWYRVEMGSTPGGTSSSGVADLAYFPLNSATATERKQVTGETLGADTITQARFGRTSASAWTGTIYFDDVVVSGIASGDVGPVGAAAIVAAGTVSAPWLIDARTSTAPNGAPTFAISQTGGTTTAATQVVAGLWKGVIDSAPLTYVVTVSESGSTSKTKTFTVPAAVVTAGTGELTYVSGAWV
jgi:hypothetical protein